MLPNTNEVVLPPGFEKIDPGTPYKWERGTAISVQTQMAFEWCPVTYNLKVVKPVTVEDLTQLVKTAVKSSGEDLFKHLFAEWFVRLRDMGLVDEASFKAAVEDQSRP